VLRKKSESLAEVMIAPDVGDPLDLPALISPAPAEERVPTYFYRPLDLLGIGFVFMGFASLVVHSLGVTEGGKGAGLVAESLVSSIIFQFITASKDSADCMAWLAVAAVAVGFPHRPDGGAFRLGSACGLPRVGLDAVDRVARGGDGARYGETAANFD
jgi:hypothetical protein